MIQQAGSDVGGDPKPRVARHLQHAHKTARAVHVIDLENLIRGQGRDERKVVAALSAYQTTCPRKVDTVVVGVAARFYEVLDKMRKRPRRGREWAFNFTLVIGHNGKDGADEALLTAMELIRLRPPQLSADYAQANFASGDHSFVDTALELQGEGMSVGHVVMGRSSAHSDWSKVGVTLRSIGKPFYKKLNDDPKAQYGPAKAETPNNSESTLAAPEDDCQPGERI